MWSMVRYKGCIVRVRRHLIETEEHAQARAWYVAAKLPLDMPDQEKESRSRLWANNKFFGISYDNHDVSDKNIP